MRSLVDLIEGIERLWHRLFCLLGFHDSRLCDPDTLEPSGPWVSIGSKYRARCPHCDKITDPFTLTRDMLP